eukprot:685745-Amorphochlora_amoeboformis.AAC.1
MGYKSTSKLSLGRKKVEEGPWQRIERIFALRTRGFYRCEGLPLSTHPDVRREKQQEESKRPTQAEENYIFEREINTFQRACFLRPSFSFPMHPTPIKASTIGRRTAIGLDDGQQHDPNFSLFGI